MIKPYSLQTQHHLREAPQGEALQEGAGGVRPDQGPRDPARGRPDGNRRERDQPLGRAETEDKRGTVRRRTCWTIKILMSLGVHQFVFVLSLNNLSCFFFKGRCTATAASTFSTTLSPQSTLTSASTSSSTSWGPGIMPSRPCFDMRCTTLNALQKISQLWSTLSKYGTASGD